MCQQSTDACRGAGFGRVHWICVSRGRPVEVHCFSLSFSSFSLLSAICVLLFLGLSVIVRSHKGRGRVLESLFEHQQSWPRSQPTDTLDHILCVVRALMSFWPVSPPHVCQRQDMELSSWTRPRSGTRKLGPRKWRQLFPCRCFFRLLVKHPLGSKGHCPTCQLV